MTDIEPRVFWPGEVLPQGIFVMARDGSVERVRYPNTRVDPWQPDPLVALELPDFDRAVRIAWGRRKAREEMDDA